MNSSPLLLLQHLSAWIYYIPLAVLSLMGVWFVWHFITFLITFLKYRHIPGHVSFLPAVIDSMLHKRVYIYHQYICTLEAYKRHPEASIIKLQFGSVCTLIVARDKTLLKELLVKNYKSISKGDVLAPVGLFGNNMFSADSSDPLWKKHRTLSNPIFTGAAHLRNVFRVTIEETNKMLEFWKRIYRVNEKSGAIEKVNVTNEFKSVTLSIINRVAFDYDIHIFDNDVKHRDALHEWVNDLLKGLLYNFVFPKACFEYLPFGIFKRFREAKERFKEAAMSMIERKQLEKSHELKDDEDLLSLLLSSSEAAKEQDQKLSKGELLSALFIIFFAGFETSSVSLNFMLRMLAKYPDVQQRIYEEITSEISSQEEITYELITEKLHFLSSFMKEVLRTKTPVGGGARIVMKKGGETLGGVKYPAGTQFLASYFSMHYFAKNGLDEFKPDRFMPTKSDSNQVTPDYLNIDFNTDEILPFSIGPRDCIGKRMALLEMKLILVMLLLQFRLEVPKGSEEQQDRIEETYIVTRTVMDPYLIDFIPRQQ
ncbi:hypothetical protein FDP41_011751 [Naegleria fowleri]|uniref:Cytochrome P450 n=1 Tax=Naegleria fowleri TaxID=5763 RepID=A0A6A5C7X3_NAEFO|nr:uncharacterized protein FDP41_011751 [Naegleria fowleri]KAF0981890.1 hypothetical protein FDP41_011751 [Naegleria fowleri]CAG4713508.1 unnamed protein product [Naegleria fowleri]